MTIYDVPVSDTKFFPVDGDTMRQMKHEEERRQHTKNDPSAVSAKTPAEAVTDPITHQGERTTMNDCTTAPMFGAHAISLPFAVTCFDREKYAILDVYKRVYVAVGLTSRHEARIAAKALNNCYCTFDDDGRLTAIYGRNLPEPRKVVGEE